MRARDKKLWSAAALDHRLFVGHRFCLGGSASFPGAASAEPALGHITVRRNTDWSGLD